MNKSIVILGTHGIPAQHGGFETCAEKLALYLKEREWHVTVFGRGDKTETKQWRGVASYKIAKTQSRWLKYLDPIIYDLKAVWVARNMNAVILTMGYNTACFNILFTLLGLRQIINMDGIEWQRPKYKRWHEKAWLKLNEWFALRIADICIADHPAIAGYLHKCNPNSTLETIAYGSDPINRDAFPADALQQLKLEQDNYGLVIARPEPENQILEIVQAWVASDTHKTLVILGHYDMNNAYHASVRNAANDRVFFLGPVYDPVMLATLRIHATVYLHGHTVGGTNPSLVEALAAGCPILAHDNLYNRGVADDAAIYFKNEAELTEQLKVFDAADLREKAIKRHQQHYLWEPILHHYERLLVTVQQKSV